MAIILPVFLSVFVIMVDLSLMFREQMVLLEAAQTAGRVVAVAPSFQLNKYSPDDLATQQADYQTDRFERAVHAAKSIVGTNGLNPNAYNYRVQRENITEAAVGQTYPAVKVSVSSREDVSRFVLIPEDLRYIKVCLQIRMRVDGQIRAPNDPYVDPEADPSCI